MEQVPKERLIRTDFRQFADHPRVDLGGVSRPGLLNRPHFNQLHSDSTGWSIGAYGGNLSRSSRPPKWPIRSRIGSPLCIGPPSQATTNRPARSFSIASRNAAMYELSK